jgi:hypothetical protein
MCLDIVYCDKNGGFELSCRSKYIHNQSTDLPESAEKILERTAFFLITGQLATIASCLPLIRRGDKQFMQISHFMKYQRIQSRLTINLTALKNYPSYPVTIF